MYKFNWRYYRDREYDAITIINYCINRFGKNGYTFQSLEWYKGYIDYEVELPTEEDAILFKIKF